MEDILCIDGPVRISGEVTVGGAKNAVLPLIFASMLTKQKVILRNVPDLSDISVTMRLLKSFGAVCSFGKGVLTLESKEITNFEAPYSAVKALRASFWAMGPLLARVKNAKVPLPGGDAIGTRPVDLHLKGFSKMGANIRMQNGVVIAEALGKLNGAEIELDFPSVGATHNILMCAALIPEETIIKGAAREPEVVALAELLSLMGAEITGAGTDEIKITGKSELNGADFSVIGDRIEAATYLAAAAATKGEVLVRGIDSKSLAQELDLFREMGCEVIASENSIHLKTDKKLKAVDFQTSPHPGVATDVQAIFLAALTKAEGSSKIVENVFESRYGHVAEYKRFGAQIEVDSRVATVTGVDKLSAAPVEGRDIRAAAGCVILGLMATGTTQIREIHHLDRGYDNIVSKFRSLGASITRLPSVDNREIIIGC